MNTLKRIIFKMGRGRDEAGKQDKRLLWRLRQEMVVILMRYWQWRGIDGLNIYYIGDVELMGYRR